MMRSRQQSKDPLERLDTPDWVTRALIAHCPAITRRRVIEPCAGASRLSRVLMADGQCSVRSFDLAPRAAGVEQANTLVRTFWRRPDLGDLRRVAVVTNPPFSGAAELARLALGEGVGLLALLVRLTWLEATNDRCDVPDPDALIIVPRPKFIESAEAQAIREAAWNPWGGDNCTVAWAIWSDEINRGIIRVNRQEKASLERRPRRPIVQCALFPAEVMAASGLIRSRRSGEKVSISASRLHVFPSDDELPSASDVRGILKAAN